MRHHLFSKFGFSLDLGFARIAIVLALIFVSRAASADVLKIVVDDAIHPIITERIARAIDEANRIHADAVLIELRTPGGLVSETMEITHEILSSPVPVIVYVTPAGNRAASAGFYILESADVAAMAPGTNTGAAHPVLAGTTMDPVMKEKLENDAAAHLRSYSGKRGRNVEVAESAVRQSKSFSADEALSLHLIDYVAKDQDDLFRQLEGKTITRFDGTKTVLHVAGKPVHLFEMTLRQSILTFLINPSISFLIFALGLLCIYFEFNHPGAILPGVVGFVAVSISLYTLNLLPLRSMAVVLIVAAFGMFLLEAKLQAHGLVATGGIVLMVLGALLLVDGPIPEMRVKLWAALAVAIPLGAITVFLMSIAMKARRNKVVTGEQGMIGEVGIVCAALMPLGKVFVHGELWDAIAPAHVEAGAKVVVRRVENLVLYVDPVREPVAQAPVHA
ncbi:MAG TPA: nodulation protein NfeD [Candidatus Angelobacter sp.]|jgi:membrane-bound serine protease (ClpP class)|nr:nodulation protein NfeD [Candidatus Angelobacter sp.]